MEKMKHFLEKSIEKMAFVCLQIIIIVNLFLFVDYANRLVFNSIGNSVVITILMYIVCLIIYIFLTRINKRVAVIYKLCPPHFTNGFC